MPKRRKGEPEKEFFERCMSDKGMNEEFPKRSQRAAVCHSYKRRKRGKS